MHSEFIELLKTCSASGFANKKGASENAPDFVIKLSTKDEIRQNILDIAIWKKHSKKGDEYYSFAFNEPYVAGMSEKPKSNRAYQAKKPVTAIADDDIPF